MTLYWFILVVSALAFGSLPAENVPLGCCLGATVMLVSAWIVLAQTASSAARRAVASGFDDLGVARILERQLDALRWMGLAVSAVCLIRFRLASAVKTWPWFESSMTLQTMALLAPGLGITASTWISEHRYGVAMSYVKSSGLRTVNELVSTLIATGGWILIPVFAILLGTDLLRYSEWFDEQAAAAIISAFTIVCIPLLVPVIIGKAWKTRPLTGPEMDWVEGLLDSCGVKRLPVRVWDTGMKSYNAVVAGFLPGLRSMIVTDRLLAEMPRQDLAMVMLHEIAHVRRYHIWLRMLVLLPSWAGAGLVSAAFPSTPIITVASNLVAVVVTLLSLRWIAHATEYDADRWACVRSLDLPAELQPPCRYQGAADRYCQALRWVTRQDHSPGKASWLHPSVDDRCARLQNWAVASEMATSMTAKGLRCG